jgi:long-chain acyl-CoA synthetase
MNMRLAPAEIDFRIEDSGARILFLDREHLSLYDQLGPAKDAIAHVVVMDDDGGSGLPSLEGLLAAAEPVADAVASGDDPALIIYTGGSTGRAKGVMLSHDNLCANAMSALQTIGYDEASVYLHAGPMSHLADGMSTFGLTLAAGTHVFLPRFTVDSCLEIIQKHRVTHICLVPTMVEMIVSRAEKGGFDVSSLVQIQFGSSPMPEGTLSRAVALWPDILFLHGYGMTELSPLITMLPMHLRRPSVGGDKLKSCGKAVPNLEVRIVDPQGRDLPPGQVGELICRGPTVMLGYWNMPEATAKAIRHGWMHTEDAAYMDEEGLVYIVDRLKDMIISGGENIYSTEVENVISRYPGVSQVAVIGVPHPLWGEAVHAVVALLEDAPVASEADIIAFCKSEIASYKCPKTVRIQRDPLPLTSAGKIDKKALRAGGAA